MTTTPITESRKREIAERCEMAMLTALACIAQIETENARLRAEVGELQRQRHCWEAGGQPAGPERVP